MRKRKILSAFGILTCAAIALSVTASANPNVRQSLPRIRASDTTQKIFNTEEEAAKYVQNEMRKGKEKISVRISCAEKNLDKMVMQNGSGFTEINRDDFVYYDLAGIYEIKNKEIKETEDGKIYTEITYGIKNEKEHQNLKKMIAGLPVLEKRLGILDKKKTDEEKTRIIFDWITTNVKSGTHNFAGDAFAEKRGSSRAFASLFSLLARDAGINVRCVESNVRIWNIVKIGNKWYQIDAAWVCSSNNIYSRYSCFLRGKDKMTMSQSQRKLKDGYKTTGWTKRYPMSVNDYCLFDKPKITDAYCNNGYIYVNENYGKRNTDLIYYADLDITENKWNNTRQTCSVIGQNGFTLITPISFYRGGAIPGLKCTFRLRVRGMWAGESPVVTKTVTLKTKTVIQNEQPGRIKKITNHRPLVKKTVYIYDGKAKKPPVNIPGLKKNKDYTLSYVNNKKIGIGTVVIKGKGNCTGIVKRTFRIVPKKAAIISLKTKKNQVTVRIKKVPGSVKYQYYANVPKAGHPKGVWIKLKTNGKTIITKKLPEGKCRIKARAYKKVKGKIYYGAFAKIKTINNINWDYYKKLKCFKSFPTAIRYAQEQCLNEEKKVNFCIRVPSRKYYKAKYGCAKGCRARPDDYFYYCFEQDIDGADDEKKLMGEYITMIMRGNNNSACKKTLYKNKKYVMFYYKKQLSYRKNIHQKTMNKKANHVIRSLHLKNKSNKEKAKRIYGWIGKHVRYDYGFRCWSGYDALLKKKSTCSGFSELYYFLCRKAGVPCHMVSGNTHGGAHAWNIIKIKGKWYQVDSCWYACDRRGSKYFGQTKHFRDHKLAPEYKEYNFAGRKLRY